MNTFFQNILCTVLKSLQIHIDDFLMETRDFIKTLSLCKQKVNTFFLSTLIALNPKWIPRLIDELQQRCHMTLLFSLFVSNIEKPTVCCISTKKNCYNVTKNNHKFQSSIAERGTSLSKSSGIFRQNLVPVKKVNL